jgi:hypothetical protein
MNEFGLTLNTYAAQYLTLGNEGYNKEGDQWSPSLLYANLERQT